MKSVLLAAATVGFLVAMPVYYDWPEMNGHQESETDEPVHLMAGRLGGTYLALADDIAKELKTQNLRVIPMVGEGARQAILDLLDFEHIDVAMLQSDTLNFARTQGIDASGELRYITALYSEEFHVLARRDIMSIYDLSGEVVNVGPAASGGSLTALFVFSDLGIQVEATNLPNDEALAALERGEIAALTRVVGQPARFFEGVQGDGLHFLSVPSVEVGPPYQSASLNPDSYPQLVDIPVETISVAAILATNASPKAPDRMARVDRFVDAFFGSIGRPRSNTDHPKWEEVNPHLDLAGWRRLDSAQAALRKIARRESNALAD